MAIPREDTMSERHCLGCTGEDRVSQLFGVCPGLPPCEECAGQEAKARSAWNMWNAACADIEQKDAEIAELKSTIEGYNVNRKGVLCGGCKDKDDEIARLRALVAVGREMAEQFCKPFDADTYWQWSIEFRQLVARWRSLEGKG